MSSVAVQTEDSLLTGVLPVQSSSHQSNGMLSGCMFDSNNCLYENCPYEDYEEEDRVEMDIEEVTLAKQSPTERLGLTLCYCPCEDSPNITDVFVSEIDPNGLAASDGRIREGDQILQINNEDVQSREQTVNLFTSGETITLVVVRPVSQECSQLSCIEEQSSSTDTGGGCIGLETSNEVALMQTSEDKSPTVKTENIIEIESSKIGAPENEAQNSAACLEEILLKLDPLSPNQDYDEPPSSAEIGASMTRSVNFSGNLLKRRDVPSKDLLLLTSTPAASSSMNSLACRPLRLVPRMGTRLESRPGTNATGPADAPKLASPSLDESRSISGSRGRLKIATSTNSVGLNPIKRIARKSRVGPVPPPPPVEINTDSSGSLYEKIDDSIAARRSCSSSGGGGPYEPLSPDSSSSHATQHPLKLPVSHTQQRRSSGTSTRHHHCHSKSSGRSARQRSATLEVRGPQIHPAGPQSQSGSKKGRESCSKRSRHALVSPGSSSAGGGHLYDLYDRYAQVMYTTPTNLEHTMMVQQQLFSQQIQQQQQQQAHHKHRRRHLITRSNSNYEGISSLNGSSGDKASSPGDEAGKTPAMEWVVKRRADGSRYITRRPVRSRTTKDRGSRRLLDEERGGITSEDEGLAESRMERMVTNRDERRRHRKDGNGEKSRDHHHRRRREHLTISRSASNPADVKEAAGTPAQEISASQPLHSPPALPDPQKLTEVNQQATELPAPPSANMVTSPASQAALVTSSQSAIAQKSLHQPQTHSQRQQKKEHSQKQQQASKTPKQQQQSQSKPHKRPSGHGRCPIVSSQGAMSSCIRSFPLLSVTTV